MRTSDMIKADLLETEVKDQNGKVIAEAIQYVDDARLFADFHALRHSTGTLLAATGVHPKVAQSIMRHSDINLTMSRYSHVLTGQEAKAISGLPDLSLPSSQKQVATGTDGKAVDAVSNGSEKWTPQWTPPVDTSYPQTASFGNIGKAELSTQGNEKTSLNGLMEPKNEVNGEGGIRFDCSL